jgi:V/A-type H+-transporting ATPase subunit I
MFRPERMRLIRILVMQEELLRVTEALAQSGVLHLLDQKELSAGKGLSSFSVDEDTIKRLQRAKDRIEAILSHFTVPARKISSGPFRMAPQALLETMEESLTEWETQIAAMQRGGERAARKIRELNRISEQLHTLEDVGLSSQDLGKFRSFSLFLGTVSRPPLDLLERALEPFAHQYYVRVISPEEAAVMVVAGSDDRDAVADGLEGAHFRAVSIPVRFKIPLDEALDQVELEIWQIREEEAEAKARWADLEKKSTETLLNRREPIEANIKVLTAMSRFGATAFSNFITGFVPASVCVQLSERIHEATHGKCVIELSEPEEEQIVREERVKVPTRFKNPAFLKPFESLVRIYGVPSYRGIDPTIFVAITFLLMFGLMFGDVGHGFTLVLIGALVAFLPSERLSQMREMGQLLMFAGGSSMLFGVLFGSVFGYEDLIDALWLRPFDEQNTMRFLFMTVLFGVGILSLGILLSVVQAFTKKAFREALFGQWGLFSGIFYWTALAVLGCALKEKNVSLYIAAPALIVPLLLVMFGDFLCAAFAKRRPGAKEVEIDVLESLFKPVEIKKPACRSSLREISWPLSWRDW